MIRACNLLEDELGRTRIHICCIAHVINLAIRAAFNVISSSISTLRKFIGAIRVSVKRREKFETLREVLS